MNRICVIDPDPAQHRVTEQLMNDAGIYGNYSFYQSAANALLDVAEAFFSDEPLPDVIILDVGMPEMNGWQFVETFCKVFSPDGERTSVYLAGADLSEKDIQRAKHYPCIKGVFTKPLSSGIFNLVSAEVPEGL